MSVIGGSDLLTKTQLIYGQNFKILPLLIVATLWYLIMVTIASVGQHFIERHCSAYQPGRKPGRGARRKGHRTARRNAGLATLASADNGGNK